MKANPAPRAKKQSPPVAKPKLMKFTEEEFASRMKVVEDIAFKKGVQLVEDTMRKEAAERPHPLALNSCELRWLAHARGPHDGWFIFSEHGNPPFGAVVQVLFVDDKAQPVCVGAGIRTDQLSPSSGKEEWNVMTPFEARAGWHMVAWRPLSDVPRATLAAPATNEGGPMSPR